MDQLTSLYHDATDQIKRRIVEDIDDYLGKSESLPSFEQYCCDRKSFVEKLWVNTWINKTTSTLTKQQKKSFLQEKGYEVKDMPRKHINQVFKAEIRNYPPFDTLSWLDKWFVHQKGHWQKRYEEARQAYLTRIEHKDKKSAEEEVEQAAKKLLDDDREYLYVYVRYKIALQIANDFKRNVKYLRVEPYKIEDKLIEQGSFSSSDYMTVSEFFMELTGAVHKPAWSQHIYEYETYYDAYLRLMDDYLSELVPEWILNHLPKSIIEHYEEMYKVPLTFSALEYILSREISRLQMLYLASVEQEYLAHLIRLSEVPFDIGIHTEIYEGDLMERERAEAEELAEIERKKEEEARIIDHIFSQEYRPSLQTDTHYVLHIGETNTGKTYRALQRLKQASTGLYLSPLRLLALEVYDKLNEEGVPCTLKTGEEEKEVEGATHFSSTVEMFHEKDFYDIIVIDEAQMIADKDRGFSWYKAITKANANEVHVIGSRNSKSMMLQLLDEDQVEIHEYTRDIPLEVEPNPFQFQDVKKGDALVCFSRRRVLETASKLQKNKVSVSMIYGAMPPETRKKQIERFNKGETTVIVATDAIGMGLNLPIRRIVFLENEKFDGTRRRRLTSQEVKQIAGRAGRKGIYNVGKVAFTSDIKSMSKLLDQDDELVSTFTVAPTYGVLERFQSHYRELDIFFELWDKFESPKGTKKSTLQEERFLYESIRGTEIEYRLPLEDLYGYLHLPFSTKEQTLVHQWRQTMFAIVEGQELPEPKINKDNLEELELSYKSIGLHLLFLYRLERRTEAHYWERIREEISDGVHEQLKSGVDETQKRCRFCRKKLASDYPYTMCNECHSERYQRKYGGRGRFRY